LKFLKVRSHTTPYSSPSILSHSQIHTVQIKWMWMCESTHMIVWLVHLKISPLYQGLIELKGVLVNEVENTVLILWSCDEYLWTFKFVMVKTWMVMVCVISEYTWSVMFRCWLCKFNTVFAHIQHVCKHILMCVCVCVCVHAHVSINSLYLDCRMNLGVIV
jgi:hypothetical protein